MVSRDRRKYAKKGEERTDVPFIWTSRRHVLNTATDGYFAAGSNSSRLLRFQKSTTSDSTATKLPTSLGGGFLVTSLRDRDSLTDYGLQLTVVGASNNAAWGGGCLLNLTLQHRFGAPLTGSSLQCVRFSYGIAFSVPTALEDWISIHFLRT